MSAVLESTKASFRSLEDLRGERWVVRFSVDGL